MGPQVGFWPNKTFHRSTYMKIKPFDDLDITDPIMFGLVFSNTHIAKPFIEHLLGIEIDHLETPTAEARKQSQGKSGNHFRRPIL